MILLMQRHIFEKTILTNFQSSFKIGKAFTNSFTYVGFEINHQRDIIEVSQKDFVNRLSFIPLTLTQQRKSQKYHTVNHEEKTMFHSVIGQANWLANLSRPDMFRCFKS